MNKKQFSAQIAIIFAIIVGFSAVFSLARAQSDDKFSDSDIDKLFGTYDAASEEKPKAEAPKRVLPPFTGNYKVLIGRPIYAVYEAETKTKWISALGELYAHYKVASFPRTYAYTMEQVSDVLPNSRDYGRKFNRQHYIDAAKKLGATHLIYQEYQPQKDGKKTRYSIELYWLAEAATVEKFSAEIPHADFEAGLNACLTKIADAMDPGAKTGAAFGTAVWGKDLKTLETFGNILADEGKFVKENAASAYALSEKIIQRSAGLVGFQYAGALLSGRAESYDKAVQHIESVVAKTPEYLALQLRLAEYLRGAARYPDAMRAAEKASRSAALKVPASVEMAMISQSQGNLDRARSEYDAIVQSGDADGRVYFRLALLSVRTGRGSDSDDYLTRASESGFSLDENEYFELGEAYSNAGAGNEEKAVEFLKKSMGVKQNREDAWGAIAELYKRMGNDQLAAESYVNMFKINMQGNSGKLKIAGEIYEKIGMTDKAKDAYALFLDRKFTDRDISLSLGRIYFNEKNCKKLPDVLKGLDTIPEAAQMLTDCGFKVRTIDASQTMQKEKLSPLKISLRYGGLGLVVGGLAGGLIIDGVVIKDLSEKYHDFGTYEDPKGTDAENYEKVRDMRKKLDSNIMLRSLLYGFAGAGLGCFAVTYFF